MKKNAMLLLALIFVCGNSIFASTTIPADNPYIQYYGRWDFSNIKAPTHSWPGVYVYAEFQGTSIGFVTDDNACWYNIYIDGVFNQVFHGNQAGVTSYTLATGLADGNHTIRISLRSETSWTKFSFRGFILDDGKTLIEPAAKPEKKIEFVGDSYTSASGNEWTGTDSAPNDSYTNLDEGFGPLTAKHYDAQYMMTSRGGIGLVVDWQRDYDNNLPAFFDRTLFSSSTPKWDFSKYVPNLVVVCLGLNDYNGFGGYQSGKVIPQDSSDYFKKKYHEFFSTLMDVYPGVKILCVAANGVEWIKKNVSEVVAEENALGNENIFYTYFPNYGTAGYVNQGHPTVETHHKISEALIEAIDKIDAWTPYSSSNPPEFVNLPDTTVVVTSIKYTLAVKTNKYATVKYSTQDKTFDEMENTFDVTGTTRTHSTIISAEQNKTYKFYLKAKDVFGNTTTASSVIEFTVDTTKQIYNWKTAGYNLSSWKKGLAPFGNDGASSNVTSLANVKNAYFRQAITITKLSAIVSYLLSASGHNGLVAYINGSEVGRMNMPGEDVTYDTFASGSGTFGNNLDISAAAKSVLVLGENIFAVEVHSANVNPSTIAFDAKLVNSSGKNYSDFGAEWYYYDKGVQPPDQLTDKPTDVENVNAALPTENRLFQNYPNPFNPETVVSYQIVKSGNVKLDVYDVLGRLVTTLVNEYQTAGFHEINFSMQSKSLSTGIYFYQLKTEGYSNIKKMLFLK